MIPRGYGSIGAGRPHSPEATEGRRKSAVNLWRECDYLPGTPAETYLRSRGLSHLAIGSYLWPLRFLADARHPSGAKLPALVALVHDARGNACAVHRTFLRPDGSGKADIDPVKMSLGPIAGSAIRLDPPSPELIVGEGLETTASARFLLGKPAWSAIACGNLGWSLILPPEVRAVTVSVDRDRYGVRAAEAAARRWRAEGRIVDFVTPDVLGEDFNDVVRRQLEA